MAPHPDADRLGETRDAFTWWLSQPERSSPTSSVTGGGAVAACEGVFGELHGGRAALLLPNATYAMRVALSVLGVGQDDEVLVPALDWTATTAAVRSLGAVPVPVAVSESTLTIDPAAAAAARTPRTRAAVACHLHGIAADVPALRVMLPALPIVEDAAGALGSTLDGGRVGTFGDLAVFSVGPGKTIDAGEGGVLLSSTHERHALAIAESCHPLRQVLAGLDPDPAKQAFSMRPHFVTAILALHKLHVWHARAAVEAYESTASRLTQEPQLLVVGRDTRRAVAQRAVPTLTRVGGQSALGSGSGAQNCAIPGTPLFGATSLLLRRLRLHITPPSP